MGKRKDRITALEMELGLCHDELMQTRRDLEAMTAWRVRETREAREVEALHRALALLRIDLRKYGIVPRVMPGPAVLRGYHKDGSGCYLPPSTCGRAHITPEMMEVMLRDRGLEGEVCDEGVGP